MARFRAWTRRLVYATGAWILLVSMLVGAAVLILSGLAGLVSRILGDHDLGRLLTGGSIAGLALCVLAVLHKQQARRDLRKLQRKYEPSP